MVGVLFYWRCLLDSCCGQSVLTTSATVIVEQRPYYAKEAIKAISLKIGGFKTCQMQRKNHILVTGGAAFGYIGKTGVVCRAAKS